MSEGFDEALAGSDRRVRDLAAGTRALILSVMPDVVEVPWPRQRVIGYRVGPKKISVHFCCVAVHKDHVNLGFNYGAELPDPEGPLQGPGKLMRHTQVRAPEDPSNPSLRRLLEVASTHRRPAKPSSQEE
jgi:hypothetical protein